MADTPPTNNNDAPVHHVEATQAAQVDAAQGASAKAAAEVYGGDAKGGAASSTSTSATDAGKTPSADTPVGTAAAAAPSLDAYKFGEPQVNLDLTAGEHNDPNWFDNISKSAADAWSGTENLLSGGASKAIASIDNFQNWFDGSSKTPDSGNDASKQGASNILDFYKDDWVSTDKASPAPAAGAAAGGDSNTHVTAKNGQVDTETANASVVHNTDGSVNATQKSTGETFKRNTDGSVDEHSAEGTTHIAGNNISDNKGFFQMERSVGGVLPKDLSGLKEGQAQQGSDGIAFRNYTNAEGGGTIAIDNKTRTIAFNENNGDKLVLNGNTQEATWTPKGGQAETMSIKQYRAEHGDTFAGFKMAEDGCSAQANDANHTTFRAGAHTAEMTATSPQNGDTVHAVVNSNGQSDLTQTAANGSFVSESKINYNDPTNAYQELNSQGQVTNTYNANDRSYKVGNDFTFSDGGVSVPDGNVFIANDGTFIASAGDSIVSDGSVGFDYASTDSGSSDSYASGDGGSATVGGQALSGMSASAREEIGVEMQSAKSEVGAAMSEVASITPSAGNVDGSMLSSLSGAEDAVQNLMDASGGRLALSGVLASIQNKENLVASKLDTGSDSADAGGKPDSVRFVDFGQEIYPRSSVG